VLVIEVPPKELLEWPVPDKPLEEWVLISRL
jgi:hypothetical protein